MKTLIGILVSFIVVVAICSSFYVGRKVERKIQNQYWMKDFKMQRKTINVLQIKANELKATYDSIKNSDCYKNSKFN